MRATLSVLLLSAVGGGWVLPSVAETGAGLGEGASRFEAPVSPRTGPIRVWYYVRVGAEEATRIRADFAWRLATAPGVGHSNRGMAEPAARWLLRERP